MLIACYAIGASVGYNYLRGEFMDQQWKVFNEALKEAYKFKLIGNNIISTCINLHRFGQLCVATSLLPTSSSAVQPTEFERLNKTVYHGIDLGATSGALRGQDEKTELSRTLLHIA